MSAAPVRRPGLVTERIVVVFLLATAVVLAWVYFFWIPSRPQRAPEPFDLSNPLLDAKPGDCVAIEADYGSLVCVRVRKEGVVLRPRHGPERLGPYKDLHRGLPYLACAIGNAPPGRDCSQADFEHGDIELYALRSFGMPYGIETQVQSIRPHWFERGGRYLYVYEVQLAQYGRTPGHAWATYLYPHPEAPVLGTVFRQMIGDRGNVTKYVFVAGPDCARRGG